MSESLALKHMPSKWIAIQTRSELKLSVVMLGTERRDMLETIRANKRLPSVPIPDRHEMIGFNDLTLAPAGQPLETRPLHFLAFACVDPCAVPRIA